MNRNYLVRCFVSLFLVPIAGVSMSSASEGDVAAPLRPHASWKAEGDQLDAWFGHSVGTAGDVNGDGYDDVIVGADHYSYGQRGVGLSSSTTVQPRASP